MTFGYIAMEVDAAVTLVVGVVQTKSIGKILERLSTLPTSFNDMRKISRRMIAFLFILLFFYVVLLTSIIYDVIVRFEEDYSLQNILGNFINNYPSCPVQ